MSEPASLLPPSATQMMRALEAADARIDAIDADVVATLGTPFDCPAEVLPFLAWAFSVDAWSESWTIEAKRAVVAAALPGHAQKGTRGGIEDAVAPFGGGLIIQEWWQQDPPGEPYTFMLRVLAGTEVRNADWFRALFNTLDRAKPLRDHYDALVDQTGSGSVEIGIVGSSASFAHFDTTVERVAA